MKVSWQSIISMMTELSLHVLDIANNSIRAGADLIEIKLQILREPDTLTITIADNGSGMTKEQIDQAEDPFFTTRTTRKVGLGIPFFKMAALSTGGSFQIESTPGTGTKVIAVFVLSHIDCMPLGDMNSTILTLINFNTKIDFLYTYMVNDKYFTLDTRQIREIINDIPINAPEVTAFIKDFLMENQRETDDCPLPLKYRT